ncbi:MAG: lamin tail domain-containing protein [Acidobacteria bacterium]|nr:lamin tail domain-containing protein [Acidobacteriota bacterium]
MPTAQAVSSTIVISQVYGGGGNSGATLRNDFIELFNRGTTTVDLSTWSVQYASPTGTGNFSANVTPLTGTIAPGQYYLVQEASNAAVGAVLPTPDASGSIAMGAGGGKVIVANTTTGIACNGSSDAISLTSSDMAMRITSKARARPRPRAPRSPIFAPPPAVPTPITTARTFRPPPPPHETRLLRSTRAAAAAP